MVGIAGQNTAEVKTVAKTAVPKVASKAMAAKAKPRSPRPKKEKPETPQDRLKKRVADELGLLEKVRQGGWGNLTAAETGRIGGLMTKWTRMGLLRPEEQAPGAVTTGEKG